MKIPMGWATLQFKLLFGLSSVINDIFCCLCRTPWLSSVPLKMRHRLVVAAGSWCRGIRSSSSRQSWVNRWQRCIASWRSITRWVLPGTPSVGHCLTYPLSLQHIVERHSETLLPQYMGMYRVTVNDNETYLLVMRNIFSPRLDIHRKYDLKVSEPQSVSFVCVFSSRLHCLGLSLQGSTVDRQASEKEKSKDLPTYKDNDFMNDGMDIHIGAEAKDRILLTIQADIDVSSVGRTCCIGLLIAVGCVWLQFLCKQNLMDYSLLVGIHDLDKAEEELNESGEEEENGYEEGGPEDDSGDDPAIGGVPTPPDSPACLISQPSFTGEIDPSIERFGLKCSEGETLHFILCLRNPQVYSSENVPEKGLHSTRVAHQVVPHTDPACLTVSEFQLCNCCRLPKEGGLFPGARGHPDALWCEEAHGSGRKDCQTRSWCRNLHRQTGAVRQAFYGLCQPHLLVISSCSFARTFPPQKKLYSRSESLIFYFHLAAIWLSSPTAELCLPPSTFPQVGRSKAGYVCTFINLHCSVDDLLCFALIREWLGTWLPPAILQSLCTRKWETVSRDQ